MAYAPFLKESGFSAPGLSEETFVIVVITEVTYTENTSSNSSVKKNVDFGKIYFLEGGDTAGLPGDSSRP
jgi:hypothetical protein